MVNYADMIFAFVISFIFTFATTPLVRRFAYKIGAVDVPKDKRRVHKRPTPRIGGLAIIFGFMVAALCFNEDWSNGTIATLIGAAILAGLLGAIYAFLTVSLKCNQNISGLALTTFGTGLTQFVMKNFVDKLGGVSAASTLYS